MKARLEAWLTRAPPWALALYATAASFSTYFCMYAFRKPFTAASFEGERFLDTDIEEKTALVIAQLAGYTISKYLGVKLVSEVGARRARALVALVVIAELALVAFAVAPPGLRALALFCNGLPLGMVWGLVVRTLEGRRSSELLLAGLSTSFIVASGAVKDVGRALLASGVSEAAMPALAGALFLLPFLLSVWLLERVPPPDAADVQARAPRTPMDAAARRAFVRRHAIGLAPLLVAYFFLTAYRDYRDNFGVEVFAELGYADQPAIFTATELPVALGVLVALALLVLVKDNRRALAGAYAVMIAGLVLLSVGTWLHTRGWIDGVGWMVLTGLGSYLAYVPFGSVLFDRLFAATGAAGTAVFAIYLADALGYTGSVGVQLGKDLLASTSSRLEFFTHFTWAMSVGGAVLLALSLAYFWRHART